MLGIFVGCKIYFGVYVIILKVVGCVVEMLVKGEFVSFGDVDVMDIDEEVFCEGMVKVKCYGEM